MLQIQMSAVVSQQMIVPIHPSQCVRVSCCAQAPPSANPAHPLHLAVYGSVVQVAAVAGELGAEPQVVYAARTGRGLAALLRSLPPSDPVLSQHSQQGVQGERKGVALVPGLSGTGRQSPVTEEQGLAQQRVAALGSLGPGAGAALDRGVGAEGAEEGELASYEPTAKRPRNTALPPLLELPAGDALLAGQDPGGAGWPVHLAGAVRAQVSCSGAGSHSQLERTVWPFGRALPPEGPGAGAGAGAETGVGLGARLGAEGGMGARAGMGLPPLPHSITFGWRMGLGRCIDAPPVLLRVVSTGSSILPPQYAGNTVGQSGSEAVGLCERVVVFACSHDGDLVMMDGATGTRMWAAQLPSRLDAGLTLCVAAPLPALASGLLSQSDPSPAFQPHIMAAAGDGRLYCLDVAAGTVCGRCSLGGEPRAPPVADPWRAGVVWATSHGRPGQPGRLTAARAPDGQCLCW